MKILFSLLSEASLLFSTGYSSRDMSGLLESFLVCTTLSCFLLPAVWFHICLCKTHFKVKSCMGSSLLGPNHFSMYFLRSPAKWFFFFLITAFICRNAQKCWMNEWTHEWINSWMNAKINERFIVLLQYVYLYYCILNLNDSLPPLSPSTYTHTGAKIVKMWRPILLYLQ